MGYKMSTLIPTALFGVTPSSLILGRACCLDDRPPVGLYDPDGQNALEGALFLGISARKDPDQLNPPDAPLRVIIVGHPEALQGVQQLTPRGSTVLVLTLFTGPLTMGPEVLHCQAVPVTESEGTSLAITAALPTITFKLAGSAAGRREGAAFLRSLSPGFQTME